MRRDSRIYEHDQRGRQHVAPFGGLTATGGVGEPFTPSTLTYTVTNTGPVSWTATSQVLWITLSSGGGVLAAGTSGWIATIPLASGVNTIKEPGRYP